MALFGLLLVSYFAFGGYRNWRYKVESDGKYYYAYLASLVEDGDLDFSNQFASPKYPWMRTEIDHYGLRNQVSPETRRPPNPFPPGAALLWAPFFAGAWGLGALLRQAGIPVDPNPYGRWFQYATMLSGPVYAALSATLLARLAARFVSLASAWLSAGVLLFASPLYYYAVFEPSMSHVSDLFAFVLFLHAVLLCREQEGFGAYVALALSGALLILVRPQNAATVAIFSCVLAWERGTPGRAAGGRSRLARLVACSLALLLGAIPILLLNRYLLGKLVLVSQGPGFLRLDQPMVVEVLFSARNGLFSHHPILLVGLAGFVALLASGRGEVPRWWLWALLGSFVAQVTLNSCAADWWSGHSFGQRRLLSSLPLFVLGLSFVVERLRELSGGTMTRPVLGAAAAAALLGLYLTLIHVFAWSYDEPHDVLHWMFVRVPGKVLSRIQALPALPVLPVLPTPPP